MGIGVKEVAFIGYPVTDAERARAFYGGVLGLKEADKFEDESGVHWVEYDIAGQTLALAVNMPNWKPGPDGAGVSLEVENLEVALETIKAAGHEVAMEIGDFPICRIAVISDPDGNGISLHQKKPNHPDCQ